MSRPWCDAKKDSNYAVLAHDELGMCRTNVDGYRVYWSCFHDVQTFTGRRSMQAMC